MKILNKFVSLGFFLIIALLVAVDTSLLFSPQALATTYTSCPTTSNDNSRVTNGIISTPSLTINGIGNFGDNLPTPSGTPIPGVCAINTTLVPFNKDDFTNGPLNYNGLKTTYYTKTQYNDGSHLAADITTGNCGSAGTRKFQLDGKVGAYYWDCNGSNLDYGVGQDVYDFTGGSSDGAVVIFVDGNLYFDSDFNYAYNGSVPTGKAYDDKGAVVFVVGGNVTIDRSVQNIDAVIIAGGTICASATAHICDTGTIASASPLTVYGNLISLDSTDTNPVNLNRTITGITASEFINSQPKYLVLLKDIFSQPLMLQTEDTKYGGI